MMGPWDQESLADSGNFIISVRKVHTSDWESFIVWEVHTTDYIHLIEAGPDAMDMIGSQSGMTLNDATVQYSTVLYSM